MENILLIGNPYLHTMTHTSLFIFIDIYKMEKHEYSVMNLGLFTSYIQHIIQKFICQ